MKMRLELLAASLLLIICVQAGIDFTELKCFSKDPAYMEFEYCNITRFNRTVKHFSVRANLLQLPVDNCLVNVMLMKKSNVYKPFILNTTVDACKFLRNPRASAIFIFFDMFLKNSNANHSCPYNHDIIMNNVDTHYVDRLAKEFVLLRNGEYALFTKWYTNKKLRSEIRIFVKLDSY